MDEEHTEEIVSSLGYKPQKDNAYNKLLPYAKHLDEESEKLFRVIKTNLVKSVLAREIRPGCALWTSKLNRYIKIYGLKFSKEDHIALIKLFYELIIIPDLEPTRVNKCAFTLSHLLKKKYLLSRDDLQLDWRPLYDLVMRTVEKSKSEIGMYRYFSSFELTLFTTIRDCKVYFPASATQEILDEFRPKLCPFDSTTIVNAIQYLELFLPNAVKPEEADISYKLWFEEFMSLWDVCHNSGTWENNMLWIVSGLARYQMGYIDWTPYVPQMFARFLRSFQLPVTFKQRQLGKTHKLDTGAMAIWISCSLHGDHNPTFFHLEKLMQTLESYFQPANVGRWTLKLREFLRKLAFFFVQRVHWERYKFPSWDNNVPEHYKLTDADIDRFVNLLKNCLAPAMFCRMGAQDVCLAFSYLASLRPNLVVPQILDKLYLSMDSLTEPHKLTSSMVATIAVGRHMIQGNQHNYPEGPTHVIPLLMALLPGIDPNDVRKSYVTFNFIVHFLNMIPIVDSSKAHQFYSDLTEEEHMICEATAEFEDFVLQFFDRMILWVDSSSLDFIRLEQMTSNNNGKNRAEAHAESAVVSVVSVVLMQSSPKIFQSALRKFYNYATQKILEVQVAGKMVAMVAHCFSVVNAVETFKLFLPYLFDSIEEALKENPNMHNEEHVDAKFLFNFLILSEVLNGREAVLPYLDKLTHILDLTLHMNCLEVQRLAARMLDLLLSTLTNMRPKEHRSSTADYGSPIETFLPVREWAKPFKLKDVKIDWYIPKEKEIAAVQMLVNKYLVPELDKLEQYSNGSLKMNRQELKCTLKIVISVLSCHLLLPIWEEPAYKLFESVLEPFAFNLIVINEGEVNMPDGSNVRKKVTDVLHKTQAKLLEVDEGDTQSLQQIVNIYNIILFNKSRITDFEMHWKSFHTAKKMLEDRLHQRKQHLRYMHIDRVLLQHEFRFESRNCSFTATHKQILDDLLQLSVSRYSEVRISAQSKLYAMIQTFAYSYTLLTPKLIEMLQLDSVKNHETFKGCLYILLGPKNSPIIARHDWNFIKQIWPFLVRSMPSEKPSIVNLITALTDTVHKFFPTIAIKLVIPERTLQAAYNLAATKPYQCDVSSFQKYIDEGEEYLNRKSLERRQAYDVTVDSLLTSLKHGNLHWRYNAMAISFIKDLVHFDVNYSPEVVQYFLKSIIHESLNIRKDAIKVLTFITIQNKPKFQKIEVDPHIFSKNINSKPLIPGEREDNLWLLYDPEKTPKTESQWDALRYLDAQATGYYAWPKKLSLYAPPSQQKSVATRLNNMNQTEQEIFDFFNNDDNINLLIKYFSLEEKKGSDHFNAYRFFLFKNFFKMYEDTLLPKFLPHLKRLAEDKHESSQRCAAEIIAGLIRGSKHWSFEKAKKLWENLLPILDAAIVNMSTETINDWTFSFTMAIESRDPYKYHWLVEFLMDDPLKDATSFVACSRLHILYLTIGQQSWRNALVYEKMLEYFKPHLSHPFQNIREKISLILQLIYGKDLTFPKGARTRGPRVEDFFAEINPRLLKLYENLLRRNQSDSTNDCDSTISIVDVTEQEKDELLRLFKVVARFLLVSITRLNYSTRTEYWTLFPLAAILQNYETDEEISTLATNLLVGLGQTMTIQKYIPDALKTIELVTHCPLWSARAVVAEFLPCFVFYNMPTLQTNPEWVLKVQQMVLTLLEDAQLEVRVQTAKVVSGLLHCHFIPEPTALLENFKQKARTKLKKIGTKNADASKKLIIRHSGVLGLCSFINAHPYEVPEYLPSVFAALGPHLSDPQPVPATIRKTMGDFKRTHHDNWELHKLKFSEEELSILSDLTVPPSYYV